MNSIWDSLPVLTVKRNSQKFQRTKMYSTNERRTESLRDSFHHYIIRSIMTQEGVSASTISICKYFGMWCLPGITYTWLHYWFGKSRQGKAGGFQQIFITTGPHCLQRLERTEISAWKFVFLPFVFAFSLVCCFHQRPPFLPLCFQPDRYSLLHPHLLLHLFPSRNTPLFSSNSSSSTYVSSPHPLLELHHQLAPQENARKIEPVNRTQESVREINARGKETTDMAEEKKKKKTLKICVHVWSLL